MTVPIIFETQIKKEKPQNSKLLLVIEYVVELALQYQHSCQLFTHMHIEKVSLLENAFQDYVPNKVKNIFVCIFMETNFN